MSDKKKKLEGVYERMEELRIVLGKHDQAIYDLSDSIQALHKWVEQNPDAIFLDKIKHILSKADNSFSLEGFNLGNLFALAEELRMECVSELDEIYREEQQ